MKIILSPQSHYAEVIRESGDAPIYSESAFWHAVKQKLKSMGHDVIKKLMSKDGHMVSDYIYYVRTRHSGKDNSFTLDDYKYAVRNVATDLREDGKVTLRMEPW